jgi:hypothetical protein
LGVPFHTVDLGLDALHCTSKEVEFSPILHRVTYDKREPIVAEHAFLAYHAIRCRIWLTDTMHGSLVYAGDSQQIHTNVLSTFQYAAKISLASWILHWGNDTFAGFFTMILFLHLLLHL